MPTEATLTYKNAYENDCDSTTSWVHLVSLALSSVGYTNCVASDIGKTVTDDGAGIGTLASYDNTLKTWWVYTTTRTTKVANLSNMAITAGTGQGVLWTCIASNDRTFTTDGDVLTISGTTADVATASTLEGIFEELDLTDFSTTTYPKLTIRFRTSASTSSKGLQAQVIVIYSDSTSSTHTLGYEVDKPVVTTVTLTAGKNVSKIQLGAIEDAAGNPSGTHYVYYDWFIFHTGTFPFPHVAPGGVTIDMPMKLVQIGIPGRDGDILQRLGMNSPTITITGDVLEGETWESSSSYPNFDYFIVAMKNDTFGYFTCFKPRIRCQVMYKNFSYGVRADGNKAKLTYTLTFVVHKLSSYSSWYDWHWMYGDAGT